MSLLRLLSVCSHKEKLYAHDWQTGEPVWECRACLKTWPRLPVMESQQKGEAA